MIQRRRCLIAFAYGLLTVAGFAIAGSIRNEPIRSFNRNYATAQLPAATAITQLNDLRSYRGHDFTVIESITCHGLGCFPREGLVQRPCLAPALCSRDWSLLIAVPSFALAPPDGYGAAAVRALHAMSQDPETRCLFREADGSSGPASETDFICISPGNELLIYRSMRL